MKSSDKEPRNRHRSCLIVDGYNIIGRMQRASLRDIAHIEAVRDELIAWLQEYSAYAGETVIVVFDAHQTKEPRRENNSGRISVVYTELNETADTRIERLVYELRDTFRQITVATSDNAEQQVTFGGGALRISADGLLRRLEQARSQIRKQLEQPATEGKTQILDTVRQDVANILEKWRRR